MKIFNHILQPYNGMKTRFQCPNCHKKGVFTKYIDTQSHEYINDSVGKCSRLIKCGYHYPPKQYYKDNAKLNNLGFERRTLPRYNPKRKSKISCIDKEVFLQSLNRDKPNYLIDFLAKHWDYEVAYELADLYNIGTSAHWNGASVFWQVDVTGRVRSGKIMLYNASNGKRVKKPYSHINWVHKVLKLDNFSLEQCFFGENLLNEYPRKPVAIVESEKTAIIANVYLPEFVWLACGSVHNLNRERTRVLKGRNVVLFPDLGCYDLWNDKIPQLTGLATFRTSTLLEDLASQEEKEQGLDLADYLLKIE